MSGYFIVFLVVQIVAAVTIIILTLLQQGKGADMGAAFGSGSAGSVFGSSGSANFLSRMTSATATVFFATTMAMAYLSTANTNPTGASVLELAGESAQTLQAPETEAGNEPVALEGVNQIPRN